MKSVILTLIILIISTIFAEWFLSAGFIPNLREVHGIDRNTGFLGMNANGASIFYNIVLGFALADLKCNPLKTQKKLDYMIISLSIIAVMLMVSKTGFIILISILLLFFYSNVRKLRFYIKEIIFIIGIMIVVYFWIGDQMTTRIQYQISGKEDTYSTRISYNEIYLKKAFSDKDILWFGHTDQPRIHKQNPHNLLVYTFYYGGIFFILILLFIYLRMIWFSISARYRIYSYVLLPVILGSLSGFTDYTVWFPMMVGLVQKDEI